MRIMRKSPLEIGAAGLAVLLAQALPALASGAKMHRHTHDDYGSSGKINQNAW